MEVLASHFPSLTDLKEVKSDVFLAKDAQALAHPTSDVCECLVLWHALPRGRHGGGGCKTKGERKNSQKGCLSCKSTLSRTPEALLKES